MDKEGVGRKDSSPGIGPTAAGGSQRPVAEEPTMR